MLEGEEEDGIELKLIALAKSLGAKDVEYDQGVFSAEFCVRKSMIDFTDALEGLDGVESYEIRTSGDDHDVVDIDDLIGDFSAVVIAYVDGDLIDYGEYEWDDDLSGEDGGHQGDIETPVELTEVKRKIKVNFRGKKRIKMQCQRGFKWDATKRACVKISGAQLAQNRKSHRRASLTKRSMGTAFKRRVLRKTKKAMRFRASLGMKT